MQEGWRKFPRPVSDNSAWARWMRPESSGGSKRPNSKRWRKLQRLVSENSASASSLNFYPNDRPRTRPAPRRYPTSAVEGDAKRGVKRGVADVPWYKVGQTHALIAMERLDTCSKYRPKLTMLLCIYVVVTLLCALGLAE